MEREAVVVAADLLEGGGVGRAVGDRDGRAVRRPHPHALGLQHVADQQRLAAVDRVHVPAVVGVAVVEAAGHRLAGVVGVAVELGPVAPGAEVGEQLQIVLDQRRAPDARRGAHVLVAAVDHRQRAAVVHRAVGRLGAAVLQAEVQEPFRAERQAGVAGEREARRIAADAVARAADGAAGRRVAVVPVEVPAGAELHAAPGARVLQLEVHDAGDGVGAVLGRRAVPQDFDLPQGDGRNGRQVRPLRPVGDAVAEPG